MKEETINKEVAEALEVYKVACETTYNVYEEAYQAALALEVAYQDMVGFRASYELANEVYAAAVGRANDATKKRATTERAEYIAKKNYEALKNKVNP